MRPAVQHSNRSDSKQRWILTQGLRDTVELFARSWARLPRAAWQAWLRALIVGWLLGAALMLALVWLGRALLADETRLFQQVVALIPFSFHAAIWVEAPGNSVFMIPVMLAATIIAARRGLPLHALSILAAFCLIDTLILLGWLIWDRSRPTLVYGGIAAPGFHSFPSGHIAQTISLYGLFVYFWARASRRWSERLFALALLIIVVVAIGLARLRLGAHWPSDIGAGALIGTAWLLTIITALRRAEAAQPQAAAALVAPAVASAKRPLR
jgi:undecaprenyl-diphosphatase